MTNGQAVFDTSTLNDGTNSINAVYGGFGPYYGSTSTNLTVTIFYQAPPGNFHYVGDDAAQGVSVQAGQSAGDADGTLTYDFVQDNGSTYTNTTASTQSITLNLVDFYAGSGAGSLTPFVATYIGAQTADSLGFATNYEVLAVGDPITVTGNSGQQNQLFTVGGIAPTITLNPGDVLTAGFEAAGSDLVSINTNATGLVDYIYDGDSLPGAAPGPLTANATFNFLDRTIQFNVGFTFNTPSPVQLIGQVSAGQFQVSWPQAQIGWQLQMQGVAINGSGGGGISTNWMNVANSTLTNLVTTPINTASNFYFRLVSP